jgi:hypothetical protein
MAIVAPDTFGDFVALGSELLEVAGRVGDRERLMQGHIYQFMAHIAAGDVTEAKVELAQASSIAGELRQPAQLCSSSVRRQSPWSRRATSPGGGLIQRPLRSVSAQPDAASLAQRAGAVPAR